MKTSRKDSESQGPALPRAEAEKRATDAKEPQRMFNTFFRAFANGTAKATGSPWAFLTALLLIILWAGSYRLFIPAGVDQTRHEQGFNTWQLVINTATTIITFLMVFLIQNTQNRDAKAIHLKLDELIRGVEGARTRLVDLEDMTDEELDRLEREFKRIREREGRKSNGNAKVAEQSAGERDKPVRP